MAVGSKHRGKPSAAVFRLNGGSLCLDFTNNVTRANVRDFGALLAWSAAAAVLGRDELRQLTAGAEAHPREAASVLRRAQALAESLYRLFASAAVHRPADALDIDRLNRELAGALPKSRLVPSSSGFAWAWGGSRELESVLWPVAVSASQVLTDGLPFVRECAGRDCRWLFIDASKNHSRQWCDMRLCGNREKARRHYARTRSVAAAARPQLAEVAPAE
ncbi:MAG: CGNR zinc finger domain-containing protein [Chloroflexota bacterium]